MEELFKKRLLEALEDSKMSKTEIAKQIGVSPEMITQYFTTKKLPKLDTFTKIYKTLEVSADYLLGLKDY